MRHDPRVGWLAAYPSEVTKDVKYVQLAASSTIKGLSDMAKFDRARALCSRIGAVRESYRRMWRSEKVEEQQLAVATYFIDRLALRVGNEKGDDEADTVGCLSLRFEHVTVDPPPGCVVHFDFLGKDSVPYKNDVEVEPAVAELVRRFLAGKVADQLLFDRISPGELNAHFKEFMPGLSAKVFRTYNASFTMDRELHERPCPRGSSLDEKRGFFEEANTKVAVLCNHQRNVGALHDRQMEKRLLEQAQLVELIGRYERLQKAKKKGTADEAALKEAWLAANKRAVDEWVEKYATAEDKEKLEAKLAARAARGDGGGDSDDDGAKPAKKRRGKSAGEGKKKTPAKPAAKRAAAAGKGKKAEANGKGKKAAAAKKAKAKAASKGKAAPEPASDSDDESGSESSASESGSDSGSDSGSESD